MNLGDAWDGAEHIIDESACPICLSEMCEGHGTAPRADEFEPDGLEPAPATVNPRRPRFISAAEEMTKARPSEVIEGVALAGRVTVIASESGAGKTFVTLDAAAAVSAGLPWHGRAVAQGSVAYLSFEGDALGLRLRAICQHSGRTLDNLYILDAHDPLAHPTREGDETAALGELIAAHALDALTIQLIATGRPPIRLLVVDTIRASMIGNEDSSEATAAYIRAIRRLLAKVPDAGALLVHHAGWQDGEQKRKRERGSSAWRGNSDATLYLEAGEYDPDTGTAPLTLVTLKIRDTEKLAPLHLIRRRIELPEALGDDLRRGPVTSCVIDRDTRTREDREAEHVRAVDAEHVQIDEKVLRVLAAHPDATSQKSIRTYVGLKWDAVADALTRIVSTRGWAVPPTKQRQPYDLTDAGRAVLEAQS